MGQYPRLIARRRGLHISQHCGGLDIKPMTADRDILDFYRRQSRMSDPGVHAPAMTALPLDIAGVARAAQGLILHEHWAPAYGQTLSDERRAEVHLRSLAAMLGRILEHEGGPLTRERPLEERLIGNCRDFTLFTVAALRARGSPARARCGFGTYFEAGKGVDHWVAEHWSAADERWVMVDAQIDALQASRVRPDFDLLDVPPTRFLVAGAAWRACRAGEADPETFGIMHMQGLGFIAGNLVRDAAALAGVEMMAWDCWGAMPDLEAKLGEADLAWFDRLAELTADPDANFAEILRVNQEDERQKLPDVVFNAVRGHPEPV
jgi:hypothetical protein